MRIVPSQVGESELVTATNTNNVELIGIYDLLGRECEYQQNQLLLYRYSDGVVVKRLSSSAKQPK